VDTAVLMEIENLRRASLVRLHENFRETFQEGTRSRHREHLFRRIAWRLQVLAEGDLTERARGRANEIARDADLRTVAPRDFFAVGGEQVQTTRGGANRDQDSRLPLPGVLLSRKWKGRTILVEVIAEGFRYENRHYASLIAIAVAVTGTRWNGLAFFGLTRPAASERKERTRAELIRMFRRDHLLVSAVQFTPVNRRRKASNRNLTLSMRNAKLPKPSFRVCGVKDGSHCLSSMTMAASPAPIWTDRLWPDCFRQSKRANWIVWWCIKSTV